MFAKFLNLDTEKRMRILNAALKEFVQKGYENASTNEIVKEAGISKGLLFHYFRNKKQLYLFLYDYAVDRIMTDFFEKIDHLEKDILLKWRQMVLLKMALIKKYPDLFHFLMGAVIEDSIEINQKNKDLIEKGYKKVMEDVDYSKFREGVNTKKAMDTIIWTFQGFANQEQEKVKASSLEDYNFENMLLELDDYIQLLKTAFYK